MRFPSLNDDSFSQGLCRQAAQRVIEPIF